MYNIIISFYKRAMATTALFVIIVMASCKKLVDIDSPVTTINQENVYKSDATAIAAVTNIYALMVSQSSGIFNGSTGISFLTGLSSDELTLDGSSMSNNKLAAYYKNELFSNATQNYGSEFWGPGGFYYFIFFCNSVIGGLESSTSLTPTVKNQLLGEAKFIRAFCHFYLVNFFGDVPVITSTDPIVNSNVSQTPKDDVYRQIIADLQEAQNLLSDNYVASDAKTTTIERVRPNKWAATALLARVYLYTGNYAEAIQQASSVINNTTLYSILPLNNVFLKNSKESIWQLQPIRTGRNTEDAFTFIITSAGPNASNPAYLSTQLLDKFEMGDQRRYGRNWVDSVKVSGSTYYFPYKYKATTTTGSAIEYLIVLRLAELYLIRAEAKAMTNDLQGAIDDVNFIRLKHGGLINPLPIPTDKMTALTAIIHERQVELFTEMGHRWLDIKRTNLVDQVMPLVSSLKGGTWQTTDQLFPLPFYDLDKNPKLIQNPGYW